MAFRASELRLILGIQSYGTTNLSRLRRDITALGRAADAANANQLRVQDQIVAKRGQVAAATQKIANLEQRIANTRNVGEARAAVAAERFAQRRLALGQRELQAMETLANRRVQISRTQGRIGEMGGSGMQKFGVADAQLQQRRLGFQNQINTLERQGIGLGAQRLRNLAAESAAARRLVAIADEMGIEREDILTRGTRHFERMPITQEMGPLKEAGLRWHAVRVDQERIAQAQADLPKQIGAVNQQLAVAAEQDKLIQFRKLEQAAAVGRQNEILQMQQGTLSTIQARLAAIKAEEKMITAQENLTNVERKKALGLLSAETQQLQVQKVALGELIAEEKVLSGVRMQNARQMDATMARAQRAQKMEARGRTAAHIGRTAQFGGLIATAGLAAAGSAFAGFNREAALAGTQMRDVSAGFDQAVIRGKRLENQILTLQREFPATGSDMANSAYEIFSSMNLVENGVVNVGKGFRLMRVANKMAVAGQVELGEATSALITVLNNFDPELDNVGQRMNEVFSIVRFGQMRLSDFAEAMAPLAPVAKTSGLALTDVGAALSTLTILMKSPQQAAQGLARAIELLQLEPFKKGLDTFGVSVEDTAGRMRPLHKIIEDLSREFPEMATGQKSAVELLTDISKASGMTKAGIQGTVQARRAIAGLVTSTALYDNILNNVIDSQKEFNDAYEALNATPGVQWEIFVNQMRVFAMVIGRAALPTLLQLGDKLIAAAKWVENLIEKTDGAIIKYAVWGGALAIVGGTILSVVGSIVALLANLKLLRIGTLAATTQAGRLASILMLLAKMGPIVITISVLIGAGGLDKITQDFDLKLAEWADQSNTPMWKKILDPREGVKSLVGWLAKADAKMQGTSIEALRMAKIVEEASKNKIPRIGEDVVRGIKPPKKGKTLAEQYWKGLQNVSKAWLESQQAVVDAVTGDKSGADDKLDRAADLAKERTNLHAQAFKDMQGKIDESVKQLGQTYDEFINKNKELMGSLGQGPALSGFLGDIFKGINDTLMQFGESIPIPISLINKDLEMQMANFTKLREGYAALLKKGIPPEVVKEIQAMGVAGLPFVQGLVQASGPEFNKFVQNVKAKQKDIEKYSKIDFNNQLAEWKKYGSDIATSIIGGLSSEAAQATLELGFRAHVTDLFGATFKKEMAAQIAEGMKTFKAAQAAEPTKADKDKATADAAAAALRVAKARRKKLLAEFDPNSDAAVAARASLAADRVGKTIMDRTRRDVTRKTQPVGIPVLKPPGGGFRTPQSTTINYNGDRNEIHADGVNPKRVKQAINKKSFENRNKRRSGV